jgi:bifunctional DNA-binding transcriptional regulator/antitoxin component of YhaV-PrlF toxin-antitoxin module
MTVVTKSKTPLVVPAAVQRKAGLVAGQKVEFRASGGVITITPKPPAADDEYSPEQRRVIDARLAAVGKGPYYGPFDSADEAIKFLRKEIRSRKTGKPKRARS